MPPVDRSRAERAAAVPTGGFAGVVGHRRLKSLLQHAVVHERVPQSLLFAGPEGVGKHAVALALAQAINCPDRRSGAGDDACGRCTTCVRIARGQYPDVTVVHRGEDASIKIRTLRERVLDVAGYRPFEGARRMFIIDDADDLTLEAQDALLKTLEEPPPSTVIVLVTARPDALRPTILSRCRRLRFGALVEDDVVRVLTERHGIGAAQARLLAATSGGSVGRALSAAGGDLGDDRDAALELLAAAQAGRVEGRLKAGAALAQHGTRRRDREALDARLGAVASLVRDLAVVSSGATTPLANADLADALRQLAPAFDAERLSSGFAAITDAQTALERNASPKIVADWLAVTL
jgi:DNA polymerase-3 subunit delta'